MIHQYKQNGYNIVVDVYSGSVHAVDELAYDAIALVDAGTPRADIAPQLLAKYKDHPEVTQADIEECLADIDELTAQGKLFAPDIYESHAFDFKNRSTVVKDEATKEYHRVYDIRDPAVPGSSSAAVKLPLIQSSWRVWSPLSPRR